MHGDPSPAYTCCEWSSFRRGQANVEFKLFLLAAACNYILFVATYLNTTRVTYIEQIVVGSRPSHGTFCFSITHYILHVFEIALKYYYLPICHSFYEKIYNTRAYIILDRYEAKSFSIAYTQSGCPRSKTQTRLAKPCLSAGLCIGYTQPSSTHRLIAGSRLLRVLLHPPTLSQVQCTRRRTDGGIVSHGNFRQFARRPDVRLRRTKVACTRRRNTFSSIRVKPTPRRCAPSF